ncbi:hypothetical protein POKO110462_10335 [Pontibacter korlensis]|uniref:Uncharacterized protein n=1 Tax=Pontibacter korlensis TaxID=400092 RepID=A0A0E3ZDV6_9BACT|nr:hypothetical protein [Pontibacter korlensis]AKD01905.1 hypothetical protein PKOR_00535 [Pontibacter korlensis]
MERHPIAGFCLEPDQQCLEAFEPSMGLLHHASSLVELLVKVHIASKAVPFLGLKAILASLGAGEQINFI